MGASQNAMWRAYCLLLLVAGSQQLSITEFHVPGAVEAGTSAELLCRYNDDRYAEDFIVKDSLVVKWWMTPPHADDEYGHRKIIYQRLAGMTVLKKGADVKDNYTIILNNLTPEDSGVYKCELSTLVEEVRRYQELIVYSNGTGIELNTTKVEDGSDEDDKPDVLLQCAAHDVSPQPELTLRVNGTEISHLTQYVSGGTEDNGGLYDVFVNATINSEEAEGAEITCELSFKNKNFDHPPYMVSVFYTSGN